MEVTGACNIAAFLHAAFTLELVTKKNIKNGYHNIQITLAFLSILLWTLNTVIEFTALKKWCNEFVWCIK